MSQYVDVSFLCVATLHVRTVWYITRFPFQEQAKKARVRGAIQKEGKPLEMRCTRAQQSGSPTSGGHPNPSPLCEETIVSQTRRTRCPGERSQLGYPCPLTEVTCFRPIQKINKTQSSHGAEDGGDVVAEATPQPDDEPLASGVDGSLASGEGSCCPPSSPSKAPPSAISSKFPPSAGRGGAWP